MKQTQFKHNLNKAKRQSNFTRQQITTITVTQFQYKNEEGIFTMFEYGKEKVIEHLGYDVSLTDIDPTDATPIKEYTVKTLDAENYINNHFKNL